MEKISILAPLNSTTKKEGIMSYNIKVTLVEPGDVLKADGSWCINRLAFNDHKRLAVRQSFRDVADPSAPLVASEGGYDGYYREHEYVVDRNGPAASHSGGLIINDEIVTYAEIVAKEGISVKDKKFLVTEVEKQDRQPGHSAGDRIVTARELTDKDEIAPNGLTVQFSQRATHSADDLLSDVNVVGCMKTAISPFKPRA
jgi:hypothetical protein